VDEEGYVFLELPNLYMGVKSSEMIIGHDRINNHEDGINVLFLNGSVEFVSRGKFDEYIDARFTLIDSELSVKSLEK